MLIDLPATRNSWKGKQKSWAILLELDAKRRLF